MQAAIWFPSCLKSEQSKEMPCTSRSLIGASESRNMTEESSSHSCRNRDIHQLPPIFILNRLLLRSHCRWVGDRWDHTSSSMALDVKDETILTSCLIRSSGHQITFYQTACSLCYTDSHWPCWVVWSRLMKSKIFLSIIKVIGTDSLVKSSNFPSARLLWRGKHRDTALKFQNWLNNQCCG